MIALLGAGLYAASSAGEKDAPKAPEASKLDMGAGLRGDSLEVKLRGDLQKILDGQTLLGDRVSAIEEGKVPPGSMQRPGKAGPASGTDDLPPAIPMDVPEFPPAPTGAEAEFDRLPPPPVAPSSEPSAPPVPPSERQVGGIGSATSPLGGDGGAAGVARSKKANRTIYLPPGFMKARLLTGIDALASRDATTNPEPIIARVQAPAVLPNDVKANLAGCFVIGNATGSLAKERVEVQLV